jgi:hypothetical protein
MREPPRKSGRFWIEMPGAEPESRRYEIGPDGLLLGRAEECDVVLDDRTVSRHHARIFPSEGFCYVKDLDSHNGVVVNGQKTGYECLSSGDVIEMGSFRLVFRSAGNPMERGDEEDKARQAEQFEQIAEEVEQAGVPEQLPLHPLAIAGLVFVGLACWFWAFGIGAVVLGTMAFFEIRSGEKYRGVPLALAAIVAGVLAGGINACVRQGGMDLLVARDRAAEQCRTNLTEIGKALREYAAEHEGRYPPSLAELSPDYIERTSALHCPLQREGDPGAGYLFPGAGAESPPEHAVIVCDDRARHRNSTGGLILRADGTVEWLPAPKMRLMLMDLEKQ